MSMEQTLGKAFIEELNKRDFYIVKDDGQRIEIEHSQTQVKIIVKCSQDDIYTVNFENKKGEKFLKSDWYLGNEFELCRDDIITIISKPEFINFSECKQAIIDEEEQSNQQFQDKKFLAINRFFNVSEVEKFEQIIQKHGFMKLNMNDDGTIDIINDDVNLTLRLSLNGSFVWVKDLSSGIESYIGDVAEEKAEEFEKTLSSRIYQLVMGNIRIHKGTEPKLTPEQDEILSDTQNKIKNVCDNISELLIYKNQKYGNSALKPNNIFYKGNAETSILIRLDDKIGRIKNNPDNELRYNDVIDIIGYLVLYLVFKKVSKADIEKLKD